MILPFVGSGRKHKNDAHPTPSPWFMGSCEKQLPECSEGLTVWGKLPPPSILGVKGMWVVDKCHVLTWEPVTRRCPPRRGPCTREDIIDLVLFMVGLGC